MVHDPLSPRKAVRTPIGIGLVLLSLLLIVYSLVIVAQVLTGLIGSLVILSGTYLTYRGLAVADSIADAAQRYAAIREHEADLKGEGAPRKVSADPTERPPMRQTDREE